MKLNKITSLTAAAAIVALSFPSSAAGGVKAYRTTSTVFIDDSGCYVSGYNINGNNYFRLRDLAHRFSSTPAKFDVVWNETRNTIELVTGDSYSGETEYADSYSETEALPTTSELIIDGAKADVTAYNIGGNNYYMLRDLGEYIPFDVYWVAEENSVCIYSRTDKSVMAKSSGGETRIMSAYLSKERWSDIINSYIYSDSDDVITVADRDGDHINIDTYNAYTYELTGSKTVPAELEKFGGFYAGKKFNYLVFGQNNEGEDDSREVVRIVKYDKSFNRLDSASVKDCYTIHPFVYGSLRMAENGNELAVHTSRERYMTEDGLNHQSQLTIMLNTDTMTVKNSLGRFQDNHVSHSFNQFVRYDGNDAVFVDHGDAYPRGVALSKKSDDSFSSLTTYNVYEVPGLVGANSTGITVGGFEIMDKNYIIAINTIDHSKVTSYDSHSLNGLDIDERDAVIYVANKNRPTDGKTIRLTDYIYNGKLASTPYTVNLGGNRCMVLWEEFEYVSSGTQDNGVKYIIVDGDGEPDIRVQSLEGAQLSADCQPTLINGEVVWYVNTKAGRLFYRIDV